MSEPWPTTGICRASINSFGYGEANAHAVLDNAHHFLQLRGLCGKHCTTVSLLNILAPCIPCLNDDLSGKSDSFNPWIRGPKVFIWTSSNKKGIESLIDMYTEHLRRLQKPGDQYLNDLAYTLSERRSSLPWKSFAVANSIADLLKKMRLCLSKAAYTGSLNFGFIFTG